MNGSHTDFTLYRDSGNFVILKEGTMKKILLVPAALLAWAVCRRQIWFLSDGNHLCKGLYGTAGDEYGRKTLFARVPFGVVVCATRYWTYEEILEEEKGDREMADRIWAEFATARQEDGTRRFLRS